MYHYTQFDPSLIRERNEKTRTEASKLRFEKRLRETRQPRLSGRHFALTFRRILSLPREAIDAAKYVSSVRARP
jgi:hypothetical protein